MIIIIIIIFYNYSYFYYYLCYNQTIITFLFEKYYKKEASEMTFCKNQ